MVARVLPYQTETCRFDDTVPGDILLSAVGGVKVRVLYYENRNTLVTRILAANGGTGLHGAEGSRYFLARSCWPSHNFRKRLRKP